MSIRKYAPMLLLVFLCVSGSLLSSTMAGGTHTLSMAAESMIVGGSNCSDFMDGLAVGMGIGALFGCVWCAGGAVIAKGVALFC